VVGGGFEMALLCDICVAADDATFFYPETAFAMIPGVAGTQSTPRLLGIGRALDLVLTGRQLTARAAAQVGVVARVVPRAALGRTAIDLARQLCDLPPAVVARAKRAVNEGLDLGLADARALEKRLAFAPNH
jgi:enoyl-CoA hydratase